MLCVKCAGISFSNRSILNNWDRSRSVRLRILSLWLSGGIGRRAGFKIQYLHGCAGSTPAWATIRDQVESHLPKIASCNFIRAGSREFCNTSLVLLINHLSISSGIRIDSSDVTSGVTISHPCAWTYPDSVDTKWWYNQNRVTERRENWKIQTKQKNLKSRPWNWPQI